METTTPFADAISGNAQKEMSQIDILRQANSKMKLEIIALKQALSSIDAALAELNANPFEEDEIDKH